MRSASGGRSGALAAVIVVALGAAACGTASPESPAAPTTSQSSEAPEGESRLFEPLARELAGGVMAVVDGVAIGRDAFDALHVDTSDLAPRDTASALNLLVINEVLTSGAARSFDIAVDAAVAEANFAERTARYSDEASLAASLATRNETPQRIRVNAELDALRAAVESRLVHDEADGFDIDKAHRDYLIDKAEVCVRQMTFASLEAHDAAAARLEAGEDFDAVAREVSIDGFVGREAGEVGAGGDLGCSAPAALPAGLDAASLDAGVGAVFGPVTARTGIHLLVVYDRTAPELAEVRDDVIDHAVAVQGPELFRLWAVGVLRAAEVEVDDAYGAWGVLPETDGVPTVVPLDMLDRIVPR